MAICTVCDNILLGKQIKFCSRKCRNTYINSKHKSYDLQKDKGMKNKLKLLNLKGKYCQMCGYSKNTAALCFHHTRDKLFGIDLRRCSNTSWEKLKEEADKCIVLCQNCHMEEHHPEHKVVQPAGLEPAINKL